MSRLFVPILHKIIRDRRCEMGLSQSEVAARVGVTRSVLSRWETGDARIPTDRVPVLADTLLLEVDTLMGMVSVRPRGRRPVSDLPGLTRRKSSILDYPIRGTLDAMRALDGDAWSVSDRVREKLGSGAYEEFIGHLPRDSAWELLAAHHIIDAGAQVRLVRPLQDLGCLLHITERDRDVYAGHRPTFALVQTGLGPRGDTTLVFLPQVSIMSKQQAITYRADFLTLVHSRSAHRYGDVEIDGPEHAPALSQDIRRTHGLGITRLGFTHAHIVRRDFIPRLHADLIRLLTRSSNRK